MFVDRVMERAQINFKDVNTNYLTSFDILQKITKEIIDKHKDVVNGITLGDIHENALENKILEVININNYRIKNKSRKDMVKEVMDNIFGYGILQKYLDIKELNGIYVNGPSNIWIQVSDKREKVDDDFGSTKNLITYIRSLGAKLGGEINENKPLAKFHDPKNKLRIVACIDPVSQFSPTISFRKHRDDNFTIKDLIDIGMLTSKQANDLIRYNLSGANIIISGKGGAGKTTLARAITETLPSQERILLMEEHPEWFLKHPGALSRLVKRNDKGHVTSLSQITDMGLLETIDRYIFGEIRGGEALPFYKGALSGNTTLSTTHSSSARDVIDMLAINMKLSGTDISTTVLKEILYKSINIIVYMDRFTVTEIVEVLREDEDNRFNDIWIYTYRQKENTFVSGVAKKVGSIKSADMAQKLISIDFELGGYF